MFHTDSESKISDQGPVAIVSAADKCGKGQGSPSLRREPSFSGWCDSSKLHSDRESLKNSHLELDKDPEEGGDIDFDLPLFNQDRFIGSSSSSSSLGSFRMESNEFVVDGENENRKYAPFSVENGSRTERNYSYLNDHSAGGREGGVRFSRNYEVAKPNSEKVLSPANVLKTLFCIMLWYTFSLFLTMYNKSLLGDHLGKFPAPLLMNTLHFAMQAVLSRAIIWFWSDRFQTDVTMSWNDYFSKDGLCL